jgi:SprT protein
MAKLSGLESPSLLLSRFPEESRYLIAEYLAKYEFRIKITAPRKQRLGSFRATNKGELPLIHINNDLGQYSFLLVFLHELAHLQVWLVYGRKVLPHGKEWKNAYHQLVLPLLSDDALSYELQACLARFFSTSKASFHRDIVFQRLLHKLDGKGELLMLKDIPEKSDFSLSDGRRMVKLERIRTRFKCYCPSNRKYYLVSPAAQVFLNSEAGLKDLHLANS